MTDTVNVSQEMIDAVMQVPVGLDEDGAEVFPGPFAAAELVRVALAAAPKVDDNALPSKSVDDKTSHDTVAKPEAQKAEPALCVSCEGRPSPENNPCHSCGAAAPKVEHEPDGWQIIEAADDHLTLRDEDTDREAVVDMAAILNPAPASDARVFSYEEAHATAAEMGYPSLTDALEDLERLQKDRDAFDGPGDSAPASDELLEAATALIGIVEGAGVLKHGKWTDEHGLRLKDTPEWVAFYNAKHKGPQS